jgi:hypothetical protein
MDKLFYSIDCKQAIIECFKMTEVDEMIDDAYKIKVTNKLTKKNDWVTTNTPQGAITLADEIRDGL